MEFVFVDVWNTSVKNNRRMADDSSFAYKKFGDRRERKSFAYLGFIPTILLLWTKPMLIAFHFFSRPSSTGQKTLKMTASDVHKCSWCEWTDDSRSWALTGAFSISFNARAAVRCFPYVRKTGFSITRIWILSKVNNYISNSVRTGL